MKHFNRGRSSTLLLQLVLIFTLGGCFQQETGNPKSSAMYWIEDKSGAMTFDEIRNTDLSTQWNKTQQGFPNFGFTDSAIWLNLPFENSNDVQTSMLLEIAFSLHDYIDVYLMDGEKIVTRFQTGDQRPFANRPLKHRYFLFPYTLPPKGKLRAVVRIESTDTMYLPVKVWESNEFFTRDQHEILLLGIFFGFLSIMLVYNLFLYHLTRHQSYFYYAWATAAIIYLQLTQKNLGFQYLWPEQPFFNHLSVPLSTYIAITSSSIFILKFLNLNKKRHTKTIITFKFFIWQGILGVLCSTFILTSIPSVIPYSIILLTTAVTGAIATIVMMGLLTNLAIRGDRSARILSIAWASLLFGSLLFALGRIGLPMPMLLTENAMLIGSTLEAALISFALARHIKKEREARMEAQELALINERKTREAQNSLLLLQKKTTQQLEQEVKERTQKLESAMQSLTTANNKLDNLARLDGLTGLSNRRDFDQEFERQWRNNARQKKIISLIMADIDHFKIINDTYGHLFGDQCLKNVADILKECVSRPRDLAARFGGEEFIVMLPDTDPEGAGLIAERIRSHIEKLCLDSQGQEVRLTISIGLSTIVPTPDTSCIDLIASADQALYLAKESGRNQVVVLDTTTKKPGTKSISPQKNPPKCPTERNTIPELTSAQFSNSHTQPVA